LPVGPHEELNALESQRDVLPRFGGKGVSKSSSARKIRAAGRIPLTVIGNPSSRILWPKSDIDIRDYLESRAYGHAREIMESTVEKRSGGIPAVRRAVAGTYPHCCRKLTAREQPLLAEAATKKEQQSREFDVPI